MDELTLFRTTHEDVQPLNDAGLRTGHARLMKQIQTNSSQKAGGRPRARAVRRIGFAALASGIAASVLIGTNVIGPAGVFGGADPAAAAVLHEAAAAALQTSDPVVGAGQYLVVRSRSVFPVFGGIGDDPEDHHYLQGQETELYIPADRTDEWVWVQDRPTIERTFGPSSAAVAKDYIDAITSEYGTEPEIVTSENGEFNNTPRFFDEQLLEQLPRDARMLLNYIYRVTFGTGPSPDGEALVYIADILRSGIVPSELRAALYEAAALIPGVTVTDDQATLDGRTGVAIGRYEPKWMSRQEIIIDPSNGLLIGEREITYATDWEIPAGTIAKWTSVTTTVENETPSEPGKP